VASASPGWRWRGRAAERPFEPGTAFVSLAGVTEAEQVLAAIARSVGAEPGDPDASLLALVERFGDGRWLLLDNLEHLVDAARDLGSAAGREAAGAVQDSKRETAPESSRPRR
jgi:predicted ATPase